MRKRAPTAARPPRPARVFIIAEAGVNHNGDMRLARRLVDAAAAAKADAIKFQTWLPGEQNGKYCFKVGYMRRTTGEAESMREMLERLRLSFDDFRELKARCRERGIQFLSTPDGYESLDFLVDDLRVPLIKVGSTEVSHPQFLEAIGRKGVPVILSTGMSTLAEVKAAVAAVRRRRKPPITVLQCTSEYPAPLEEVNLRAMVTMRDALGLPVGLSDHSLGCEAAVAAVALGATMVEKHFTLDKSLPGPDHQASLSPDELARFVASIRATETLLGDGLKRMTPSEVRNAPGIRRSVVAARPLPKGTILSRDMLACKRPGTGLPPAALDGLIGRRTNRDLGDEEPIRAEFLSR